MIRDKSFDVGIVDRYLVHFSNEEMHELEAKTEKEIEWLALGDAIEKIQVVIGTRVEAITVGDPVYKGPNLILAHYFMSRYMNKKFVK